ncbi:MAG: adenosylcobinamide-GDP ribazoletransferase [Ilumatobacteraceae bacterium]
MVRLSTRFRSDNGFLAATQFLTRIPITLDREPSLPRAVPWFPLVGVCIGAIVGGVAAGMWAITPPLVAAGVAVAVGLLVTGAFHEDGLADVADAFGGGWTVERRVAILKDSRHGTYGVAALCTSIVVRIVCLGSLPGPAVMFAAAVAAHTLGRGVAVALTATVRPAIPGGLGATAAGSLETRTAVVGVVGGTALAGLIVGWWIGPLALAAAAGAVAVAALAIRKIGGIVGDVLGAAEQVVECLCLVVMTGLATHHPLWWR